jgi:hypothetical protein
MKSDTSKEFSVRLRNAQVGIHKPIKLGTAVGRHLSIAIISFQVTVQALLFFKWRKHG